MQLHGAHQALPVKPAAAMLRVPVRSALYRPAHFPEVHHAVPDVVILDLEDGVRPEDKPSARAALHTSVDVVRRAGSTAAVRLNGADTPWFAEDLAVALEANADVLVLPKADADQLAELQASTAGSIPLWAMVESAATVDAIDEMARAALACQALLVGINDLASSMGLDARRPSAVLDTLRGLIAAAAADSGLYAIDGLHLQPDVDMAGACRRSVELGFSGRSAYRTHDVAACNEAFPLNPLPPKKERP